MKMTEDERLERRRESSRKFRAKNLEKIKEYKKQHYEENSEKIKECCRNYRIKNSEKVKEGDKKYRFKNPEKIKKRAIKSRFNLQNCYIGQLLKAKGFDGEQITPELIETQRLIIKIKRKVKQSV